MSTKRPVGALGRCWASGSASAARAAAVGLTSLLLGATVGTLGANAGEFCVSCSGPDATYLCRLPDDPNAPRGTAGQLYCITELAKKGGHKTCSVKRQAGGQPCDGIEQVLGPPSGNAPALPFAGPPSSSAGPEESPDVSGPEPLMTPALREPAPDLDRTYDNRSGNDGIDASADPIAVYTEDGGEPVDVAKPAGPPKTVEELAKQSLKSSKENLDAAGSAVGNTAKSAGQTVSNAAKKTGEQIGKVGSAVGSAAKTTWKCLSSLFSDC
jgi:hypothetical protein